MVSQQEQAPAQVSKTQRVYPFKPDPEKAKINSFRVGNKIWQLMDADLNQVYAGTIFKYKTQSTQREIMVRVRNLSGRAGKCIHVQECDKSGQYTEGSFQLRLSTHRIGLHWQKLSAEKMAEPGTPLAKKLEESKRNLQKKQADRAKALAKAETLKQAITPENTLEEVEEICRSLNYMDFNRARQIRDDKIAKLIEPGHSEADLEQMANKYQMSLRAMTTIRENKRRLHR